jgi:endo-1,4-beta-xylanase
MDVPLGEIPGSAEEKLEAQRVLTRDIVAACVSIPQCGGITFWGLCDKHSWLNEPKWGAMRGKQPHLPLPLDANYLPKPMYQGILDALGARPPFAAPGGAEAK